VPEPDTGALERLRRVRGFVLDMDGTLVLGDRDNKGLTLLPGALDFLTTLHDLGLPFCVFTNGTVKTPAQCADALQQAGLPVPDDAVLTPASSAVEVFRRRGHRRVMVLGVKGITEVLEQAGIEALPPLRGTTCDAVFAGWYRQELTIEALEAAIEAVNGAASAFVMPAMTGILPAIVDKADLPQATAISGFARSSAMIGGGAVAGVIVVVVLPYILATAGVLSTGPSQWLLRVTPAAAFAIQQTVPAYPQVDAAYTPLQGFFPLSPWTGFAVLGAWTAVACAAATYLLRRRDA